HEDCREPIDTLGENPLEAEIERLSLASGDSKTGKIMIIADRADLTLDQKMREIGKLDQRWKSKGSPEWAALCKVSASAVRQTDAWNDEFAPYRNGPA